MRNKYYQGIKEHKVTCKAKSTYFIFTTAFSDFILLVPVKIKMSAYTANVCT